MSDFKTRLEDEEKDLNAKIGKLYDFTQSDSFKNIIPIQKQLLLIQLEAMRTYWRCLITRIDSL